MTTKLVDTLYVAGLIVFVVGLRQLIAAARPDHEWLARLVLAAGLVTSVVTLVGDVLGAGVVAVTAEVDRKSDAQILTRLSAAVAGVVAVKSHLSYRYDDEKRRDDPGYGAAQRGVVTSQLRRGLRAWAVGG